MNTSTTKSQRRLRASHMLATLLVGTVFLGCDTKTQTQEEEAAAITKPVIATPKTDHSSLKEKTVVATVNGIALYEDKLNAMVQKQLKKDRRFSTSTANSAQLNLLKQKVLNKMINDEVLRQASLKEPVANLQQKIDAERTAIEEKFGSKEAFNHYMASMGMNTSQFDDFLKEKIHLQEYFKKYGLNDPDIPEEQIRDFYDKGKQNFSRGKMVNVSQILLSFDNNNTPQYQEIVFEKAQKIRKQLKEGESFGALARQYSQSAEANETNGSLGFIKKGYMPKTFEEAAFSLKEGDISEPVRTRFGYHIIKVNTIEPPRTAPYEEVRNFIKKYLQESIIVKNTLSHVQKLRDAADVTILIPSSESSH